jgi:putative FmdB family regulatory protein
MPNYEYECEACERTWEAQHGVAHRHDEVCSECGKEAALIIGGASVHSFTPHYSNSLGCWLTSHKEKRAIMKSMGVEEITACDDHYIDHAVTRNKAENEKREEKKQFEGFVKEWDRVQAQLPSSQNYED